MPQQFYDNYRNKGFHFPTSLLTTYCLSLKTKPFVILSGISGTGKTKIAQLFTIPQPEHNEADNVVVQNAEPTNALYITVRNSWVQGDGRTNFRYETLNTLLTQDEIDAIEPVRQQFIAEGVDNNFSDFYPITIEAPDGTIIHGEFYLQRPHSPLVRVRFRSRRDGPINFDSRTYFQEHYHDGDVVQLEQIGLRHFRIVAEPTEEAVTIANALEEQELAQVERICFIPVKSDWTDSSELFGHYNLIGRKYHLTKFLKFLLEARDYPNYPFFVILDEMNLSKVEHYFSDFLSCLESRYQMNDDIVQEKITLHASDDLLETDDIYHDLIPGSIEIPTNLFVTGTVNIDESTYMFSSKVLDRANVIEFNHVDLHAYGQPAPEEEVIDAEAFKLSSFPDFTILELSTKENYENLSADIKVHIEEINKILSKYHRHFGYRTANEMALYIKNAKTYIADTVEIELKALDLQLVQKVFPKLSGGYASLELPLRELLKYLARLPMGLDEITADNINNIDEDDTSFPVTVTKLKRMYNNLIQNGFTSFIE